MVAQRPEGSDDAPGAVSSRTPGDTDAGYAAEFEHTFAGLMDLLGRLRGPDGCPWDRGQSRESLCSQFLEEAYELIEAIEEGDPEAIAEEVGDVILHAGFQIQLAREDGSFTETDVFGSLIAKLVHRHPHVFSANRQSLDAGQVLASWDELKRAEKPDSGRRSAIDGVPRAMPALARAQEIQSKARKTGFDWDELSGVIDKIREETGELAEARTGEEAEAELGDLLFSVVNAARWLDIDAETALRGANRRFAERFRAMENLARERGSDLRDLYPEDRESLWAEVKADLSRRAAGRRGD